MLLRVKLGFGRKPRRILFSVPRFDLVTCWCILSTKMALVCPKNPAVSLFLETMGYILGKNIILCTTTTGQMTLTRRRPLSFPFLSFHPVPSFSDMKEVMKENNLLMFVKVILHLVECTSIWCLAGVLGTLTTPVIQQALDVFFSGAMPSCGLDALVESWIIPSIHGLWGKRTIFLCWYFLITPNKLIQESRSRRMWFIVNWHPLLGKHTWRWRWSACFFLFCLRNTPLKGHHRHDRHLNQNNYRRIHVMTINGRWLTLVYITPSIMMKLRSISWSRDCCSIPLPTPRRF